jgi:hypothetical protein
MVSFRGGFFVALLAFELETDVRGTPFRGKYPEAICHRRIVSEVLSMPAC